LNRILVFFLGLIAGGILVFALGELFPRIIIQHTTIQNEIAEDNQDSIMVPKKTKRRDTTKQQLIEKIDNNPDSGEEIASFVEDSSDQELIVRERMIGSRMVTIQSSSQPTKDTTATGQLSSKFDDSGFSKTILVEFWESPIDFMGYKLSKTKLILYGFIPQGLFSLTMQEGDTLLMEVDGKAVLLKKTEKYKTLSF
jgi:hypothetical protein